MTYVGSRPANKAVQTTDIEDDAITSAKIAAGVVVASDLAANSVDSSELVDGSIDTSHLSADAVDGTKLADNAVNSEHYTDGSIDTAHIADDQITLAKMASGTDGNIISYDASGNPVAIATGSDGQVLTSTGAGSPPAFETVAGAAEGYKFLSHSTIGSNTDVVIISGLTSTYKNYRFILNHVQTDDTGGVTVRFNLRTSSETLSNDYYKSAHVYINTESAGGGYEQSGTTSFRLVDSIGSSSGSELSGWFDVFNITHAYVKRVNFHFQHVRAAGGHYVKVGGGRIQTGDVCDGIRLTVSSGQLEGGTLTVYGMAEA